MPPKKKPRLSSRAPSTLSVETPTEMVIEAPESGIMAKTDGATPEDPMTDPWTDEQEISLYKGMIKWKPVGMHKHFRMLSISQHLQNHGHNPKSEPHIGIPGIWKKLDSLYNLKVLDEREDSYGELGSEDNDPAKEPFLPFSLPESDFGDMMFERRLAGDSSSSPPSLLHQLSNEGNSGRRRPSVIDDSEEPRSSPVSARGLKANRGRGRGGRRSLLHEDSMPTARSASKASVDVSGDGEEQEDEDDDEEASAEESDEGTPTSSARGARAGRKPGRRGRRGGWRGGPRRGGRHKK
ncbi:hypothetical protein MMC30_006955 [Trapelia coarctata]|nr:hypothetical protein [Trapelia coarctata]